MTTSRNCYKEAAVAQDQVSDLLRLRLMRGVHGLICLAELDLREASKDTELNIQKRKAAQQKLKEMTGLYEVLLVIPDEHLDQFFPATISEKQKKRRAGLEFARAQLKLTADAQQKLNQEQGAESSGTDLLPGPDQLDLESLPNEPVL